MSTPQTTTNNQSLTFTNSDEIQKVFNRFDTNNDGKISSSELINVMKAIGSDTSDEQLNQMMKTIDADCDGYINFNEFVGFFKQNAADEDEQMKELHEAFQMYDLNKNGLISATELHQILSRLGENCTVEDCVKMIQSVDSDGDGFVDFDEFKKMMTKNSGEGA
ncbi:hypothetical protein QVD17_18399 [Tagetes erecta]|uniref:EF-hand domain-containing protein n=1 Tax=Tagetes erecta TaxID=13708 RepID=A0AAD8KHP1_TARER|nr:hypothetical protein QVD17_18399 [Tagetes erecta]